MQYTCKAIVPSAKVIALSSGKYILIRLAKTNRILSCNVLCSVLSINQPLGQVCGVGESTVCPSKLSPGEKIAGREMPRTFPPGEQHP